MNFVSTTSEVLIRPVGCYDGPLSAYRDSQFECLNVKLSFTAYLHKGQGLIVSVFNVSIPTKNEHFHVFKWYTTPC